MRSHPHCVLRWWAQTMAVKETIGNNAGNKAAEINSFMNFFWNDISFANRETPLQSSCLQK